MKALLKYQRLTILWALFVLVLCSVKISDKVTHQPFFFPGFDKLVHSGFFLVLVVFWCNGLIRQQNTRLISYKSAIIVTIFAIAYGGLIEVLQSTVFIWRSGDWTDLFADTIGACMGIFSVMITDRAINYEES